MKFYFELTTGHTKRCGEVSRHHQDQEDTRNNICRTGYIQNILCILIGTLLQRTVCPRSSAPLYIVTYYIKQVTVAIINKTFCIYSNIHTGIMLLFIMLVQRVNEYTHFASIFIWLLTMYKWARLLKHTVYVLLYVQEVINPLIIFGSNYSSNLIHVT